MSAPKCEHNNHTHFLLWLFIIMIAFNSSCVDCSGERTRQENRIRDLEWKVQQLQTAKDKQ